jgi:hypothetical protein
MPRPERACDFHTLPGEFTSRTEIARQTGLTPMQVEETERLALVKLRRSAPLREAYRRYKADGMPQLDRIRWGIQTAVRSREEALMLQLQREIMDWWRVHDLAGAMEMPEEAMEIRQLIAQSQQLLANELGLARS